MEGLDCVGEGSVGEEDQRSLMEKALGHALDLFLVHFSILSCITRVVEQHSSPSSEGTVVIPHHLYSIFSEG